MALSKVDPNFLNVSQVGGRRNLIINGAMTIDQRNEGSSVANINAAGSYIVDRWKSMSVNTWGGSGAIFTMQQNMDSLTPPAGFKHYLGVLCQNGDSSLPSNASHDLSQMIEGHDSIRLAWGTSDAKDVTLSFWVRSNLTGTFGGSITNGTYSEYYVWSYTIDAANTWEYKTVTISGETSGAWQTSNNIGLGVNFNLNAGSAVQSTPGVWTSGPDVGPTGQQQIGLTTNNVFYITGVQLEVGDTATPFEHRSYAEELSLCQRYFQRKLIPQDYNDSLNNSSQYNSFDLANTMRSNGTVSVRTQIRYWTGGTAANVTPTLYGSTNHILMTATGLSSGRGWIDGEVNVDSEFY
jgi:hypothetical protein